MNTLREMTEFNVLGYRLKLSPDGGENGVAPDEVVNYFLKEAESIQEKSPGLDPGRVALLAALKIAADKLALDSEYRENVDKLQTSAKDALQFIEEVSPTTL